MKTTTLLIAAFTSTVSVGCATDELAETATTSFDQASSVHLKGGARAKPAFFDSGLTLKASGDLSGLGNGDVVVSLAAIGDPVATCANPSSGERQPPGQNPAPVEVTGSVAIPANEIKNGTLHFAVTTRAPASPIEGAPDCPNAKWTEVITDMKFSDATITVEQPLGTIVLAVSCVFTPETTNGSVSGSRVSCSF